MFAPASLFACLAATAHLAAGLTLQTPSSVEAGTPVTISWTSESGDPSTFTLQLVNAPVLLNAIAIANNVPTSDGSITLTLPIVPADSSYTINAVNIFNVSDVFAETGGFAVSAAPSTVPTSTVPSTASGASTTSPPIGSSTPRSTPLSTPASSSASGTLPRTTTPSSPTTNPASSASATTSAFNGASSVLAPEKMLVAGCMGVVAVIAGLML